MAKTIKRKNRRKSKRTRYRKGGSNEKKNNKFPTVKENVLLVFKNSTELQNLLKEKTGYSFNDIEKQVEKVDNEIFVKSARKKATELLTDINRVQEGGDGEEPFWVKLARFMACCAAQIGLGYNPRNHPCRSL